MQIREDNMNCTFFGHRDTPHSIASALRVAIIDLIENKGVDLFYVGNQGAFDRMTIRVLRELKEKYPKIKYYVVLSYVPQDKEKLGLDGKDSTLYPACLDKTPPKYAIIKRNNWMLERADFVIAYVTHITNGAYEFKQFAEKKGKTVINLADFSTLFC